MGTFVGPAPMNVARIEMKRAEDDLFVKSGRMRSRLAASAWGTRYQKTALNWLYLLSKRGASRVGVRFVTMTPPGGVGVENRILPGSPNVQTARLAAGATTTVTMYSYPRMLESGVVYAASIGADWPLSMETASPISAESSTTSEAVRRFARGFPRNVLTGANKATTPSRVQPIDAQTIEWTISWVADRPRREPGTPRGRIRTCDLGVMSRLGSGRHGQYPGVQRCESLRDDLRSAQVGKGSGKGCRGSGIVTFASLTGLPVPSCDRSRLRS